MPFWGCPCGSGSTLLRGIRFYPSPIPKSKVQLYNAFLGKDSIKSTNCPKVRAKMGYGARIKIQVP